MGRKDTSAYDIYLREENGKTVVAVYTREKKMGKQLLQLLVVAAVTVHAALTMRPI